MIILYRARKVNFFAAHLVRLTVRHTRYGARISFSMKKSGKFSSIKIAAAANTLILVMLVSLSLFALAPLADETTASADGGPVYSAASDDKIALMFNVYQGEEFVLDALDLLDDYGAKCTFFVGGCWADDHVGVLREIYARGHELGNHGYFHKDHKGLSQTDNLAEIEPTNALIEAVTGASPALFAPPSGSWDDATVAACASIGMKTIMWSRDTIDWRDQNAAVIFTRATKDLKGGELILAHPTKSTVEALPAILQYVKGEGLKAVTVSELLAD